MQSDWQSGVERAGQRLQVISSKLQLASRQPAVRIASFVMAVLLFLGGILLSVNALPEDVGLQRFDYLWWIALVGAPLIVLSNVLELKWSARVVGVRVGLAAAGKIAIMSSAANLLPVPGGAMVRVGALKVAGARIGAGTSVTIVIAVLWLGLALLFAGIWLITNQPTAVGTFILVSGALVSLLAVAWIRIIGASWELVGFAVIIKSFAIFVGMLRMYWSFRSLGVGVQFPETSVFALANVTGAAVSIFPAGLGVTEVAAAALAEFTAATASAAFIATALNRIAGLIPLLIAAAIIAITQRRNRCNQSSIL